MRPRIRRPDRERPRSARCFSQSSGRTSSEEQPAYPSVNDVHSPCVSSKIDRTPRSAKRWGCAPTRSPRSSGAHAPSSAGRCGVRRSTSICYPRSAERGWMQCRTSSTELRAESTTDLEAHMEDCRDCRRTLATYQEAGSRLRGLAPALPIVAIVARLGHALRASAEMPLSIGTAAAVTAAAVVTAGGGGALVTHYAATTGSRTAAPRTIVQRTAPVVPRAQRARGPPCRATRAGCERIGATSGLPAAISRHSSDLADRGDRGAGRPRSCNAREGPTLANPCPESSPGRSPADEPDATRANAGGGHEGQARKGNQATHRTGRRPPHRRRRLPGSRTRRPDRPRHLPARRTCHRTRQDADRTGEDTGEGRSTARPGAEDPDGREDEALEADAASASSATPDTGRGDAAPPRRPRRHRRRERADATRTRRTAHERQSRDILRRPARRRDDANPASGLRSVRAFHGRRRGERAPGERARSAREEGGCCAACIPFLIRRRVPHSAPLDLADRPFGGPIGDRRDRTGAGFERSRFQRQGPRPEVDLPRAGRRLSLSASRVRRRNIEPITLTLTGRRDTRSVPRGSTPGDGR